MGEGRANKGPAQTLTEPHMNRPATSALLVGLVAPLLFAGPALAGPARGGVDVPATFGALRTASTTIVVSTRVRSPKPASTVTRVMVHRNGKELYNKTQRGLVVNRTVTAKPGDYITVTATDGRNVDREAKRVVVGPMK